MSSALIVCVGNDLVADDGVGHEVHAELKKRMLPDSIRLKLLGLGGISLIEEFSGEQVLVVVDAVQFGSRPGEIHSFSWDQLPSSGSHVSCHGIGIREAIEVSLKLYPERTPRMAYLVGIEGSCFDQLGRGLTPEVAASVHLAADRVLSLIENHREN